MVLAVNGPASTQHAWGISLGSMKWAAHAVPFDREQPSIDKRSTDKNVPASVLLSRTAGQTRRIITARSKQAKRSSPDKDYTVGQLKHDIAESTRVKTSYVREAKAKEGRFMTLLSGVNALFSTSKSTSTPARNMM